MNQALKPIAIATMIAAVTAPHQAAARDGRIAAGIIGGVAAGAIIGSIIANRGYYYGPGYYYAPVPYYGYYSGPYEYDPGPYDYGPAYYGGTHYYYPPPENRRYKHWTEF
jgi:hypothetical protein